MNIRSILCAFILSALLLAGGMAAQVQARTQTLAQTLSGCNGVAPSEPSRQPLLPTDR